MLYCIERTTQFNSALHPIPMKLSLTTLYIWNTERDLNDKKVEEDETLEPYKHLNSFLDFVRFHI